MKSMCLINPQPASHSLKALAPQRYSQSTTRLQESLSTPEEEVVSFAETLPANRRSLPFRQLVRHLCLEIP